MGKVVKTVVGVVTTVVGVVTGNPALIIQGVSMTFSAVTEKKPKSAATQATQQRLSKSLTPEVPRKIVLGKTALPTDLRYWEVYGAKYTNYVEVMAAATHRIHSFGNLYIDEAAVGFSGTAATGKYAGALKRYTRTQGVSGQGMPLGSGSRWNTSAAMTGCAYWVLDWTWTQEKLPNGIPSRYTQEGEGSPVYDPRRDSTRGGSGSHRADDNSTWEYAPLDSNGQPIGRNNALQMLRILIGWRVTSPQTGQKVLVDGRGVNLDDINYPSFIEAANDCELERWYSDCVLSTGDSHSTNEGILEAAAGGKLADTGGRWSYRVATDDTANVAVFLSDDDFEGLQFEWKPRRPMSEQFNEIAGTYIDPNALYQARPFPLIYNQAYYDADGFKKRTTVALSAVQDVLQAQKLMRIKLNAQRRQGVFRATFNWKPLLAENLDCVRLSFTPLGFVNKLFRVIEMGLTPQGVDLTLQEEDAAVYLGGTVLPYTPPSTGSNYDSAMKIDVGAVIFAPWGINGANGAAQDAARLSWFVAPENVRYSEVRYRVNGTTLWTSYAGGLGRDQNAVIIGPLLANTTYDFEVRHVSVDGVPGDWSPVSGTTNAVTRNSAGQIVYSDGTPIDNLRPGEAGANITENRTSAAIVGQGWGATASEENAANNRLVGPNANRVVLSNFDRGNTGWGVGLWQVPGTPVLNRNEFLGIPWVGNESFPTAAGQLVSISQRNDIGYKFPLQDGERVSIQVGLDFDGSAVNSSAFVDVRVWYKTSDGATYEHGHTLPRIYGSYGWNGKVRDFVTISAPGKTVVEGWIEVYFYSGGAGQMNVRLMQPMVTTASASQTIHPPYSPGANAVPGSDPTGQNTAAAIVGQQWGATASEDQAGNSKLFGPNSNRVVFSNYDRGTTGWDRLYNNGFVEEPFHVGQYVGKNFMKVVGTAPGPGATLSMGQNFNDIAYRFRVSPNERLSVQYKGEVSANSRLRGIIWWFDQNGGRGEATGVTDCEPGTPFGSLRTAFVQAPAYAVTAYLEFYMDSVAAGWSSASVHEVMVSSANPSQTIHPPYSAGPAAVPGSDPTGQNTAAAIVGQTVWATASQPISRISRLRDNGRLLNTYVVSNGVLTGTTLVRNPVYVVGSQVNGSAAQINVAAHTLKGSGISVSYAAGSISGLAFETTYYVWAYDPDVVGGAVTYVATTDPNAYIDNADYLFISNIRTVASGGGTPAPAPPPYTPPGYTDCVQADAWLPTLVRARDVGEGDPLLMLRVDGEAVEAGRATANRLALAHCMIFTTVSGITLTCSSTTPILFQREGEPYGAKPAWECDGSEVVPVLDADGFRWEPLAHAPGHIGQMLVAHISASDGVYAAGDERGRFIFTHNIRMNDYVKP